MKRAFISGLLGVMIAGNVQSTEMDKMWGVDVEGGERKTASLKAIHFMPLSE